MKPAIGPIPRALYDQLLAIPASTDRVLEYRPATLTLKNGSRVPRAYVVPYEPYLKLWGPAWEGRSYVPIAEVAALAESPERLPAALATKLYEAGESGMGYTIFTLKFRDGTDHAVGVGNALDYIKLPEGKSPKDVVDVLPGEGRARAVSGKLDFSWVLYEGIAG